MPRQGPLPQVQAIRSLRSGVQVHWCDGSPSCAFKSVSPAWRIPTANRFQALNGHTLPFDSNHDPGPSGPTTAAEAGAGEINQLTAPVSQPLVRLQGLIGGQAADILVDSGANGSFAAESVVRCIEMGAEDYLPKPFDPVLLKARTVACLERKRAHDREDQFTKELQESYRRGDW